MAYASPEAGWWQASDGKWYPPQAAQGWWQASDGNWYPPDARPGAPAAGSTATLTREPTAAAATARKPLGPQGDPPMADDVVPADTETHSVLATRATAQARLDWAASAQEPISRFAVTHGQDPSAVSTLSPPADGAPAQLHWGLEELRTGEEQLTSLLAQRDVAARTLARAEQDARSLRVKLIVTGVITLTALAVIVLLVLSVS